MTDTLKFQPDIENPTCLADSMLREVVIDAVGNRLIHAGMSTEDAQRIARQGGDMFFSPDGVDYTNLQVF